MRRRTFLCVALLVLVLALTFAFVTAQEEAVPQPEHQEEEVATAAAVVAEAPAEGSAAAADAVPEQEAAAVEVNEDANAQAEEAAAAEAEKVAAAEAEAAALRQQQAEEAERQRREEEERIRLAEEEAQRRRQEEEERVRREEEEERQRQAAEAERLRREEEDRKRREAEEAARRAAEEKAKRELEAIDAIRSNAKVLSEGCVSAVEHYLFRVHEDRQRPAGAVRDTRAALNDARVNAPGKVAALEKRLATAQDALLVYDVQTLRTYGGNLPKTCIAEAQEWYEAQPDVESKNTYVQAYTHFHRLIAAHVVTLYRTGKGVVFYLMHAYTPALASFTASASEYQNKAWAIYEELFPAKGNRPEMPIAQLAKQFGTMVSYASVPIGLGVAAGIVAVVALPPVAAYVLVYEYLYKIWAELFIFYYIYGIKLPDGLVAAARTTVANVKASEWDVLSTRAADAFFDLVVDSDRIFYNGILAIFLLGHVVVIAAILVCVWCRCCVPGMRRRKAKKSPLNADKSKSAKPAAAKPAAAKPAASQEKKKN